RDRVEFKGARTNKYVIEKMKRSSLYVMSSLGEGFGITFLEAMAHGTPVIGGNVGGTKELIKNGENGFLVNPGDYKDLADKISIILDNDLIREKFIKNGSETAKNFSVERMVEKTLEIYFDEIK
ncbi:MAG: glycosyltransferase family 4 protein, partial [Candidatus Pacebacteria bacterium]|nr:glycosyltransferase family 4 protein [Candidatus Paceibacterota bacterium]